MQKYYFLWMLSFICLSGCASLTKAPMPQNQVISWDHRVHTLSSLHTWNLDAVIAMRNEASHEGGTANMTWQQNQSHYHILLFGPLGSNAVTLSGGPGNAQLEAANGQRFHAESPEALLAQQTGFHLPVSNLFYWVRGLPVPTLPAEKEFDAYHHLVQLRQAGWTIQFLRYTSVNQWEVPDKIFMANSLYSVKLVIHKWAL
jgi:outer membrane lipoprotein LolB